MIALDELILDVKSLRVPSREGLPCGLSPCPSDFDYPLARMSTERLYEEFPAYGPVLLRLAVPNLRTVIVTAAVYRGFSLRLRLAADHAL